MGSVVALRAGLLRGVVDALTELRLRQRNGVIFVELGHSRRLDLGGLLHLGLDHAGEHLAVDLSMRAVLSSSSTERRVP
jgi:hypothetical protein